MLYEARANTGINKMKIIDTVAKSVPSPHKVDLSNPEINIVVQIVKVHIFAYKCVLYFLFFLHFSIIQTTRFFWPWLYYFYFLFLLICGKHSALDTLRVS